MGRARSGDAQLLNVVIAVAAAALALLATAPSAGAATVVARNPRWVSLKVNKSGVALVTYYHHGRTNHTLAWGAKNAIAPRRGARQRHFHVNYAGGYGSSLGTGYWKKVAKHDVCQPYPGPRLWRVVAACTAPNGTNWALQVWQADLRDNGWRRRGGRAATELFLSHWDGPLPSLWFKANWTYAGAKGGPYDLIYGQFTYRGQPVYGYSSSDRGAPEDSFGRLVALDTYNPPWKHGYRQPDGWWRQNSFLSHRPYGDFCPGVFRTISGVPTRSKPGRGSEYRIIANGPGVTPVVEWQSAPPGYYRPGLSNLTPSQDQRGPYSAALDKALNADQRALDPVPKKPSSCYYTH